MPHNHSESGHSAPQGKIPGLPKKPAGKIRAEHCYCSHPAADHDSESGCSQCGCQQHQARPCVCGHGAAQHNPSCEVEACDCKRFAEDRSPEFLLRRGIRAGCWQFITTEQLRFLMRPDQDFQVRVWACGMLHSVGKKTRLAVKWVNGKPAPVPLSPTDIVAELNALDTIGAATKQHVRRAIADLESQGACWRVGTLRNNVRLYFYLRPLTAKAVKPELEPIDSLKNKGLADLVAKFGYQKLVEETAENLAQVAKSDPLYKEDSISSSNRDSVPPSSSNTPPIVENTPEPETTTTEKDPVLEALTTYGPAEQEAAD